MSTISDKKIVAELGDLAAIKPHAIITTNYDCFLEKVFDGYEPIIGQTILRYNTSSFGEIFHIHGDVSTPESLVLTKSDYADWNMKKKYVSAKLLTYFAEHPVFIFGYGLGDPNVKSILRDIGEIVADDSGLIPNVFHVVWRPSPIEKLPPDQAVFSVDGREFRIKAIHTGDLSWVFRALRSRAAISSINPKLVRALAARTMKLIRHDIPFGEVQVNYDVLERVADEKDHLPNLLGITSVSNPNQSHPFTLTQVAKRIGLRNWNQVSKLINRIKDETGTDLRSTDNRYHCRIKTGTKDSSATRKWSHEAIELFKKVKVGDPYQLGPMDL
ncbi:MAG: SIR2 family protein [Rhodobacteraceae bacterium]|nr:SIR2 family protein [Paracoccaceae bacterium]